MFLKRFIIQGDSMEPEFFKGQNVLVMNYFFRKPRIGDVVVLRHPNYPEIKLIKRIISIDNNKYFVRGNKGNRDSQEFGYIERDRIIGKVI